MIKENQKVFNGLLLVGDWFCISASLLAAYGVRFQFFPYAPDALRLPAYLRLLPFLLPVYTILFYLFGLYNSKRNTSMTKELFRLFEADAVGMILLITFLYLVEENYYSKLCLLFFACISAVVVGGERLFLRLTLRHIRKKGYNIKYILLIGGGGTAQDFYKRVVQNPDFGYRFCGCLAEGKKPAWLKKEVFFKPLKDISKCLQEFAVDEVVVALELNEYKKLPKIINCCEKNGTKINVIPAYFRYMPSRPRLDEFDGIPVMILRKIPLSNAWNAGIKRLFDIVVSLFCIVLFSPIMLATYCIIFLTMRENPIYCQERLGYNCKPFVMYKFRSMRGSAVTGGEETPGWTQKHDARRTKFGAFIRRFSIDELPQFFNVLWGEMSIVGPRPEVKCYVDQFRETIPRYMVKHQVKPGITGWAQVHGLRGDTSIEERINSDIYYIENWSLLLDMQIILFTVSRAFYNDNE